VSGFIGFPNGLGDRDPLQPTAKPENVGSTKRILRNGRKVRRRG
jgi:hypothetical protein